VNEPTLCAQLWRLPALLVDDFSELTPELLRTAYVEALYRVDEFEFERLTQSYWQVSDSMSTQPLFDMCVTLTLNHKHCCMLTRTLLMSGCCPPISLSLSLSVRFLPDADDPTFCRPAVPFSCGPLHDQCGPGTKRTPKTYS
jgi:hypothetical protein